MSNPLEDWPIFAILNRLLKRLKRMDWRDWTWLAIGLLIAVALGYWGLEFIGFVESRQGAMRR